MGISLTPKARLLKTLAGEKPDVLPAAPCYLSLFLADFERKNYIEQYRQRLQGISHLAVDHQEDTRFRAQAVYQSYGLFKTRPDWIEVGTGASKAWAARTEIVQTDGVLCYQDRLSGMCVPMHTIPIPSGDDELSEASSTRDVWDISAQLSSPEDLDAVMPVMTASQWLARGDFDLPRLLVQEYGEEFFISTVLDTPFSDAYDLLGFQGLMVIQHDRPDLLHHLLQRKLAQTQELMAAWAQVGVHGVFVEEVFTGADLISPRSYEKFVFAYNLPYFKTMSGLGLLPIHYVCGDVIPRLESIMAYDIAAVAVEESKKNFRIEIEDVIDRVAGRKVVFGNIDAVRFGQQAEPQEMEAEVQRQAALGSRAKGFVISTGSPFPVDTNPVLIDTLIETAHSFPSQAPGMTGK